ncbi:hypothetical protein AX16_009293 [Volvariella volvacea WC 439]|nr:hypothetical protein AX16_009293 [Volvariella volvacea WC 439]
MRISSTGNERLHISTQYAVEEPRLPQELERIIFLIAARNDRDRTLLVLMQVARRVRSWLQELVYETVVLGEPEFYLESKSPLHHPARFPSGPQTSYVRNFLVYSHMLNESEPYWVDLLPECHNIENFGMWCISSRVKTKNIISLLTSAIQSPLRTVPSCGLLRLSASLVDLFPDGSVEFNHLVFKDLTHLELLDFPSESDGKWVEGNNLGCLSQLRYLAVASFDFSYAFPIDILRKCLEECKSLEVLRYPDKTEDYETEQLLNSIPRIMNIDGTMQEVPEDRVVVRRGPFLYDDEWTTDWYKGTVGGEDIWVQSEKVVLRKRWRRELGIISWNSLVDSDANVNLGDWLIAMEKC